jgi:ABC-type transport system involved in multi-copper enzyme maturation permease subunit
MKGLLLKDFYTLLKQLKLYLVFIVILSVIPSMNMTSIGIVYAAMLPITVIAFDERSKWDQLAVMMPYTRNELVLSKFLIGYIAVAVTCLISLGIQVIIGAVNGQALTMEQMLTVVLTAFAGVILLAINLPFMFWLGVERGRIVFLVLIAATVFLGMMSVDSIKAMMDYSTITSATLLLGGAAAVIVSNVVAVAISNRVYQRKFL